MVRESKRRANAKYDKANTTGIYLKLNNNTDNDILDHLQSISNKQGYIKELIRENIKKGTEIKIRKEVKHGRSSNT